MFIFDDWPLFTCELKNVSLTMQPVEVIECSRDAMQGFKTWIPTEKKIAYAQSLLKVGFSVLDVGSFVSPKAIPQMRDTEEVLYSLDRTGSSTELLTIVANSRGAMQACNHSQVDWLGYPFSISENFQMRNTHKTLAESLHLLDEIIELTSQKNKKLVVYLSMGFGNPYGDPWSTELVGEWLQLLSSKGITTLSLSDTVGTASPFLIHQLFSEIIPLYPNMNIGAHLHANPKEVMKKIDAAYGAGCRRFDGAISGFGGCPMAKDELVGNLPTEKILSYLSTHKIPHSINPLHFESAYNQCLKTFN